MQQNQAMRIHFRSPGNYIAKSTLSFNRGAIQEAGPVPSGISNEYPSTRDPVSHRLEAFLLKPTGYRVSYVHVTSYKLVSPLDAQLEKVRKTWLPNFRFRTCGLLLYSTMEGSSASWIV